MQITLFLALAASILCAFAQQYVELFDFSSVAPCAPQCLVLTAGQQHCTPPLAPKSDRETYLACYCSFAPLVALQVREVICPQLCSDVEQHDIYTAFIKLCAQSMTSSSQTMSSISSPPSSLPPDAASTTSTAASTDFPVSVTSITLATSSTLTTPSVAIQPTELAPPHPPQDHGAWLHGNWKYLVVAGVLLVVAMVILFATAFLCRRRRRQNTKHGSAIGDNNAIPLRTLSPRVSRSRPGTSSSEAGQQPTTPASPLAPASSPHSFGERLRQIAREEAEREAWYAARREAGYVPSWRLQRSQGTLGEE